MHSIMQSFGIDNTEVCLLDKIVDGCRERNGNIDEACIMSLGYRVEPKCNGDMMLGKYCSHEEKLLMGANWAHGISHEE